MVRWLSHQLSQPAVSIAEAFKLDAHQIHQREKQAARLAVVVALFELVAAIVLSPDGLIHPIWPVLCGTGMGIEVGADIAIFHQR